MQLCSYCNVHSAMVLCRHCDPFNPDQRANHGVICYGCLICLPTGGMCRECFDKFKAVHGKNHEKDLEDPRFMKFIADTFREGFLWALNKNFGNKKG